MPNLISEPLNSLTASKTRKKIKGQEVTKALDLERNLKNELIGGARKTSMTSFFIP
jgi:hypothetical protein